MLFTTYKFALFVIGAFAVYWTAARLWTSRTPQNLVLLLAGYGFYALFDWRWCFLLAGVTGTGLLGDCLLGGWARAPEGAAAAGGTAGSEAPSPGAPLPGEATRPGAAPSEMAPPGAARRRLTRRRLILATVIIVDLAVLGVFKYFDFFVSTVASALGTSADHVTLNLVLPIGVSYYIFQNLSYVIDVYRGDIPGRRSLLDYAVALSFFPQLLSGPITRPRELLPQLALHRGFDEGRARDGLRQILWGLVKKMVVADSIALLVDGAWKNTAGLDRMGVVLVAILYSIQIYCDFSGYADIAIGTAKLFNLRLARNFDHPYLSSSVRQFWRRWHISLAFWMRDYVYIPLGGSRRGALRRHLNTLVTFLLVGLWHGANLTFLVWGLLHGAYLVFENVAARLRAGVRGAARAADGAGAGSREAAAEPRPPALWRRLAGGLVVFVVVTFAWVFFRAPSLSAAVDFLRRILSAPLGSAGDVHYVIWIAVGAALLVFEALTPGWEHGFAFPCWWRPLRWAVYLGACLVIVLFARFGGQQGIYVQF